MFLMGFEYRRFPYVQLAQYNFCPRTSVARSFSVLKLWTEYDKRQCETKQKDDAQFLFCRALQYL